MKTVLTKFLAFGGIALLTLASCKKNDPIVTSSGGKPGTLAVSTSNLTLEKARVADTTKIINFSFSKANYGYSAAVTTTLQIDVPSDNWAKPMSITLGANTTSQGYATSDFNAILLKLSLPAGVASQIQARLMQSVSTSINPIYSNTLALSVIPYSLVSYIYVPGNYEGWANPGTSEDSLQSATSNGVYTGVINFQQTSDQFLITPLKNWANKYATTQGPGTGSPIVYTTEYVTGGGNNFYSSSKATVDPNVNITSDIVTLDANANTLTLTPTLWSVVGDATPGGWPNSTGQQSDTDMKFNNGTQTWSVVVALKAGGAIKFRLNHDWGKNYGSVTTAGVLDTADNNNINITVAGNYLITVDIAHLTYTLVKQ